MKITTESGLKLDIDENVFDDMELIDALAELEENPIAISKVVKMMFGADGKKQLYDHCRNEKGRVETVRVNNEITDIFRKLSEKIKK